MPISEISLPIDGEGTVVSSLVRGSLLLAPGKGTIFEGRLTRLSLVAFNCEETPVLAALRDDIGTICDGSSWTFLAT